MAIYSGFSTRKLEDKYNQLVSDTMTLLSQIIITYVERSKLAPFETQFSKILSVIQKMDQFKHSEPKYSQILKPLDYHINLVEEVHSIKGQEQIKSMKRRPHTTSNPRSEKRSSIDYERKTITTMPPNSLSKSRKSTDKKQRYSNSFNETNNSKIVQLVDEPPQTMEQLMEKNKLIDRKMSAFRKKKYLQQTRIPRIQEVQEEQNEVSFF